MSHEDDRKMKEELFGSIGVANPSGPHAVDPKSLLEPLEWTEGVSRVFCKRCGETIEIDLILSKKMAEKSGNIPASFEGLYFEVRGCILCSGGYKQPSMKLISSA
jgi:hypothetical protein